MKIPFPYWLAAEFYLFQPPPKKLTLIHFLILVTAAGASTWIFLFLSSKINAIVLVAFCAFVICALAALLHRCCCYFLPLLTKGVDRGVVQQPDLARLEQQIQANAGWD